MTENKQTKNFKAKLKHDVSLEGEELPKPRFYNGKYSVEKVSGTVASTRKETFFTKMFGCHNCIWYGTISCPHDIPYINPKGKRRDTHNNGICQYQIKFIKSLVNCDTPLVKAKQIYNLVKNDVWADDYIKRLIEEGNESDTLVIRKVIADMYEKYVKQEQGSKVTVTKRVSPADVAKLIEVAKETD